MTGVFHPRENHAMKIRLSWLKMLGILAATAAPTVTGSDFDLSRHTVDAGGTSSARGGAFELSGTVGQPDAGKPLSGGVFELTGGFWFRLIPGNCNEDAGVDLFDHRDLEVCMTGPSVGPGEAPCPCLDLDNDNDVDLADLAEFQLNFGL
jgi:hypothetical protein